MASSENSYREMGPTFTRDVWRAIVLSDLFTDIRTGIRLLAKNPEASLQIFTSVWADVMLSFQQNPEELEKAVARAGLVFSDIPKRQTLDDVKKVLVVGEIYVRRDNFSVQEISEFLLKQGIYPKLADISEWFHYTDYARKLVLDQRKKRDGFWKTLTKGGFQEEAWFHVEEFWKNSVENKLAGLLKPTGFIPDVPHDMSQIIGQGSKLFVDPDLESEATVSPAVAAAAMQQGYSGIAIIAPFGCLPGRLIEGVYAPWAKAHGYPVIALENDGQPYPPNIVARMEIFAHNVARFEKSENTLEVKPKTREIPVDLVDQSEAL